MTALCECTPINKIGCRHLPACTVNIKSQRPVFADRQQRTKEWSTVERHGQARYEQGNAELLLSIRCDRPDNALTKGSRALILDYDQDNNVYHVEPIDDLLTA